jgi:hypothetical protein
MSATFFLILLSAAACGSGGAGSDAGPDRTRRALICRLPTRTFGPWTFGPLST